MRKKYLWVLLPALLLIGGYLYVRISLPVAIAKEEKRTGSVLPAADSLGGKKLSVADLRPLFIKRLQQVLKKSSAGLYNLSVADLKIDLLASTVSLQGVKMEPDTTVMKALKSVGALPENVFTVSFDSLQINNINLNDAVNTKNMAYSLVKVFRPAIIIHRQKPKGKNAGDNENFSQRFLKEMEKLAIKKVEVEDGSLAVFNDAKKEGPVKLLHVNIALNDLLLTNATRSDTTRFLFSTSATIAFKNFSRPTKDGLYNLKIGSTVIKEPQGDVQLTDLSFASPLSKEAFTKKHRFSISLYELHFPAVQMHKMAWWTLLNEEELAAADVAIPAGRVAVYLDRSLPSKPVYKSFPSQMLMAAKLPVNIGRLQLKNLAFSYEEFNPLSKQSGTMYMDNGSLTINHISNEKVRHPKPLTATASALFMHSVPLQASFNFNMEKHNEGAFTANIKVHGFEGSLVNSFAMPMGLIKMEKGTLQGAEADISGNENGASGNVFIPYTDLKLSLMEKNKDRPGLNQKHITSFLANLLVIKNDNPKKGGEPRKVVAEYKAPPGSPFLFIVWKTLLVGALKTMGAPTKMAYQTVEDSLKK